MRLEVLKPDSRCRDEINEKRGAEFASPSRPSTEPERNRWPEQAQPPIQKENAKSDEHAEPIEATTSETPGRGRSVFGNAVIVIGTVGALLTILSPWVA